MNQFIVNVTQKRAIKHLWKSIVNTLGDKKISTLRLETIQCSIKDTKKQSLFDFISTQSADRKIIENDCRFLKDVKKFVVVSKGRNDEIIVDESVKNVTEVIFERIEQEGYKYDLRLDLIVCDKETDTKRIYKCYFILDE